MRRFLKMYEKKLDKYEKEYIEIWGRLYESRGQVKLLGKIWGLLSLKADSPENGLEQNEIVEYLQSSLSSVSRYLKKLVEMNAVKYIDQKNEKNRIYYTGRNFQQITKTRFTASINEYTFILTKLEEIRSGIPSDEKENNFELITQIDQIEIVFRNVNNIFRTILGI